MKAARAVGVVSRRTKVVSYTFLIFWSVVVLAPLYWMVTTSFKRPTDVFNVSFVPWIDFQPTLDAWRYIFVEAPDQVFKPYMNSVIVSVVSSILTLVIGAMAGYALARFRFRWGKLSNKDVAFWFISQRMLPPVVLVFPFLIVFKTFNLLDTLPGLILAYTAFNLPFAVWITRDFFMQLPEELEASAMVDGYTRWQAFRKVVLPLSTPGLLAAFLFILIFAWNEYLFALMLTFQDATTLPIFILAQNAQRGPEWWTMSALAVLAVIPVAIAGIVLERFLHRGVLLGSVK